MISAEKLAEVPRLQPRINEANKAYWTSGKDGKLLILRHKVTGQWAHPPESVVDQIEDYEPTAVSGEGTIYTFTINHHHYNPLLKDPYAIALVQLKEDENLHVPTNIVNCNAEDIFIGMPVRVRFEKNGDYFFPVFEPASEERT